MSRSPHILERRLFLAAGLAAGTSLALPASLRAQTPSGSLVVTPRQTTGPYYPVTFPPDSDEDLVVLRGAAARAQGIVTHLSGRVRAADGGPLAGATVEIWQCDANGRYHHPGDRDGRPPDQAFQGYGRFTTDSEGRYRFRTIRPVAYPGRTPHIHFAVRAPGRRDLVTQMYVAGEPANGRDGLYRSLTDPRQREAVTVRLEPANGIEAGALAGIFDLVLG